MNYPGKCDECGYLVQLQAHLCGCGPYKTVVRLDAALRASEAEVERLGAEAAMWRGRAFAAAENATNLVLHRDQRVKSCAVSCCTGPLNIRGQTLCARHLNEALDARGLDWKPA